MTTILATFGIALTLSLVLTPLAGRLGARFGAMDVPNERKVHVKPVARIGGVAIFLAFLLTILISKFLRTDVSSLFAMERQMLFLLGGAFICFGVGVFDDFRRLGARTKFVFQILAASVAFYGGIDVGCCFVLDYTFNFGFLSYFVTVFWFVLFINAVNLVDGLDGLAGGIVFFASMVMVILSVLRGDYLLAMLFSILAGSILGFLRYNFNPASIFLGDGGSYFLGYSIAGLSIMGSAKSQVGAAVLIPLLALGVPLFDTILSPLRRFVRGRKMFRPDDGHIHHKLMKMGLSAKKVVWLIYMITFSLCILAVLMVNIRDEKAGLFLIVLGAGAVIFVRKLGYLEYLASDKLYGWFKDLTDEAGLSRERRSFLSLQIDIDSSANFEELWQNITCALEYLEFDFASFYLNIEGKGEKFKRQSGGNGKDRSERRKIPFYDASVSMRKEPPKRRWSRKTFDQDEVVYSRCFLRLELPLLGADEKNYGVLLLLKNLRGNSLSYFTLKRVEHLRRSIIRTLEKLEKIKLRMDTHDDFGKKIFFGWLDDFKKLGKKEDQMVRR